MSELKPCPWCGGNVTLCYGVDSYTYFYRCSKCSASIHLYYAVKDEAIDGWNKRATDEELEFTRQYIHDQGLEWDLLSKWNERKKRDD